MFNQSFRDTCYLLVGAGIRGCKRPGECFESGDHTRLVKKGLVHKGLQWLLSLLLHSH